MFISRNNKIIETKQLNIINLTLISLSIHNTNFINYSIEINKTEYQMVYL